MGREPGEHGRPHDSRPVSDEEDAAFDAEGRHLAARTAEELPAAAVRYWKDDPDRR